MIKLEAAARLLAADEWWDSLGDEQQKTYVDEHPNSRYAEDYHPSGSKPSKPAKPEQTKPSTDPDKPKTVNEPPKKPATPKPAPKPESTSEQAPPKSTRETLKEGLKPPPPLETPKALEEGPGGEPEETTPEKKPAPKKSGRPKDEEEKSLLKHLLRKGGAAGKKKAMELLKKGGHEALRRLIDPLALTDVGKKGELPELPFKLKSKEGKIKDLQTKLTKLRKQQKGFGKNVPENLKKQIKDLSDKLEQLQE
jgi:hypothetical protein